MKCSVMLRTGTAANFALTLRRLRRLALTEHATPARVAACGGLPRLRGAS
jgi:hypothetical protein